MKTFLTLIVLLFCFACHSINPTQSGTKPVAHDAFTTILQKYVDVSGNVNYSGLRNDPTALTTYLEQLSDNPPNDQWTKQEQLAYWINVYNAFTLELILNHYPVTSIKDIGSKIQIPFINSPWDIKLVRIGDEMYTLNNVEHNILRKNFNEPRIHFAIVCASISCPKLLNEAFTADKLESQLTQQSIAFLSDRSKNELSDPNNPKLSKIFSWFTSDFTQSGSLIDFINRYAPQPISKKANIEYLDYDWNLNGQ
jgi:hypothetical protein